MLIPDKSMLTSTVHTKRERQFVLYKMMASKQPAVFAAKLFAENTIYYVFSQSSFMLFQGLRIYEFC